MAKRTRTTTFNIETEAQRLYAMAQAKGDFSGAASVLRLLRDLRAADAPSLVETGIGFPVSACTPSELQQLDDLIAALERWKTGVRARLEVEAARAKLGIENPKLAPAPTDPSAVPTEPPPAPPAVEPPPDPDELIEVIGSQGPCLVRRGDLTEENLV